MIAMIGYWFLGYGVTRCMLALDRDFEIAMRKIEAHVSFQEYYIKRNLRFKSGILRAKLEVLISLFWPVFFVMQLLIWLTGGHWGKR